MTEQPKALQLADEFNGGEWIAHTSQWKEEAAALVAAAEREECAKVCEGLMLGLPGDQCAYAIRARKQQ